HTWVSEGTRGLESVVTLTFEPEGDKTRVTLRHTGVPDDDFGRQHRDGWASVLGAIEERFAKSAR
ncbi:MAG: SRPBCC domain-containing protein, partial [Candidatus Eisenbacteria bacterium]